MKSARCCSRHERSAIFRSFANKTLFGIFGVRGEARAADDSTLRLRPRGRGGRSANELRSFYGNVAGQGEQETHAGAGGADDEAAHGVGVEA